MNFKKLSSYSIALILFFSLAVLNFFISIVFPEINQEIFNSTFFINLMVLPLVFYFCLKSLHEQMTLINYSMNVTFVQFCLKLLLGFLLFYSLPKIITFKFNDQKEFETFFKIIEIFDVKFIIGIYSYTLLYLILIPMNLLGTFYLYTYITQKNVSLTHYTFSKSLTFLPFLLCMFFLITFFTSGLNIIYSKTVFNFTSLFLILYYMSIFRFIK